ncbi:hypothetical protein LINPERPRIM_LOCUS17519 [Linum perenne]
MSLTLVSMFFYFTDVSLQY